MAWIDTSQVDSGDAFCRRMRSGSLSCWLTMGWLVLMQATAFSQTSDTSLDLSDPKNVDAASLTELRVVLVGEAGEPVVGAAVMPYAMRMRDENGHGYWNSDKLGPPKDYFSDASGVAVIRYPAKVYALPEPMVTSLVTFQVRHADFVSKVVDCELGADLDQPLDETQVELKKGCELQLSAIDDQGQPLQGFGVVMAGPYEPAFWADDGEGGKRTSSLNDGTWQTMLVKPQADGTHWFSGLLAMRVRPSQALRIRNVKLSPGTRVSGVLADNVPRPVCGGTVMTVTLPKPEGDAWGEIAPSLLWYEWAEIQADGTFELPSVPRSGQIQVIATCDGWVSKTTIAEAGSFVMGQLFEIADPATEVVVDMEATGTLELTVLDPTGQPLNSGSVSTWPNQRYYKGGSTFLGARLRTVHQVMNQLLPADQRTSNWWKSDENIPFVDRPIENGVAVLQGQSVGPSALSCVFDWVS
jgi:hypothetical protein